MSDPVKSQTDSFDWFITAGTIACARVMYLALFWWSDKTYRGEYPRPLLGRDWIPLRGGR